MGLTRRNFLQQAGFSLLALGADLQPTNVPSETTSLGNAYLQRVSGAQGGKLALLVGIDRYPFSKNLTGCLTDVELQRELLIGRFGFHRQDILTLTDRQATREAIETAFVEHLIARAREGDTVLFHFSGYGNTVKRPPLVEGAPERWQKSLLPTDGLLPTKGEPANNELLGDTLSLLVRSLATQRVTLVLDTSYRQTGQLLQGNLRSRSPLVPAAECPGPQELAFQTQLKTDLKLARSRAAVSGAAILAAADSQTALEGQWDGFSAGLLTYTLVRHLWEITPPNALYVAWKRTRDDIHRIAEPDPQFLTPKGESEASEALLPLQEPLGAEGITLAVEERNTTVRLQLAGLPPEVLAYYQPNSSLLLDLKPLAETAPSTPFPVVPVQVRSRAGLTVTAKLLEALPPGYTLQPGLLAREQIRVLPRNVGLTVALAADLERIERVDATSAFSNVSGVTSVVPAGEQMADCLFAKSGTAKTNAPTAEGEGNAVLEAPGRGYALFAPGRVLFANTLGAPEEGVAAAVDRLKPKLQTLLAEKLWRLTLNEGSSRLDVCISLMVLDPEPRVAIARSPLRASLQNPEQAPQSLSVPQLAAGTRIQYAIENSSDRPVYFVLLGVNARKEPIALYSSQTQDNTSKPKAVEIAPATPLALPQSPTTTWTVPDALGVTEFYAIVSIAPFAKTLEALAAVPDAPAAGEFLRKLSNPLEVARALLQDLHEASGVDADVLGAPSDVCALDVNAWTTFDLIYEVVPAI